MIAAHVDFDQLLSLLRVGPEGLEFELILQLGISVVSLVANVNSLLGDIFSISGYVGIDHFSNSPRLLDRRSEIRQV